MEALKSSRSKALSDVRVSSDKAVGAVTDARNDAIKKAKAGLTALENAKDSVLSDVADAERKALDAIAAKKETNLQNVVEKTKIGLVALQNAKDSALSDVSDAEKKALDAVSGQVRAMLAQMLTECEWKEVDFTASQESVCCP